MIRIKKITKSIDYKKLIVVGVSALVAREIFLAPLGFLWGGWLTALAAIMA